MSKYSTQNMQIYSHVYTQVCTDTDNAVYVKIVLLFIIPINMLSVIKFFTACFNKWQGLYLDKWLFKVNTLADH